MSEPGAGSSLRAAIKRIVGFTLIAIVVYGLVIGVATLVTPPGSLDRATAAPLGVGLAGLIAYYLVYMDGDERLRRSLGR